MNLFELPPGRRIAISGSTGTGKTTLALDYLQSSSLHWIIFNPKWTRIYERLKGHSKLTRIDRTHIERSLRKFQYTILNFSDVWDWYAQDQLLSWIINKYENIGICIDELYTIHNNSRAGIGLNGLITRGRELGQSFIGCTQRPVYVSKFVFSEADVIVEFHLLLEDDRKVIYKMTGVRAAMTPWPGHDFLFFDVADRKATIYRG